MSWISLAGGLTIGIFDYQGYNTSSYIGGEVVNPGKVIPKSIVLFILGIRVIFLLVQIGVLGVVDCPDRTADGGDGDRSEALADYLPDGAAQASTNAVAALPDVVLPAAECARVHRLDFRLRLRRAELSWPPSDRMVVGLAAAGVIAYFIWARVEHLRPFGPKTIDEQYLQQDASGPTP